MASLFGIGTSALLALQNQLATTSHNIANATRPDYSRQRVELTSNRPDPISGAFVGSGVHTQSVTRSYDAFLGEQLRDLNSTQGGLASMQRVLDQLDVLLSDANSGLSQGMDNFFASLNDLADNPTSSAVRATVLSDAGALLGSAHAVGQRLDEMSRAINSDIEVGVARINQLAGDLAGVNRLLNAAQGNAQGGAANDLLDQRDALLQQLSGLLDVQAVEMADGSVNVFVGKGQSLVLSGNSFALDTQPGRFDAQALDVVYSGAGGGVISDQLTGGELGGLLRARGESLTDAYNSVGRMMLGLADGINDLQRRGMDLDGNLGSDLFAVTVAGISGATGNAGNLQLSGTIVDPAQLTNSDYLLSVDVGGNFIATRLTDKVTQNLGPAPGPFTLDGVQIDLVAGAAVAGDSYLLRPTRPAVDGITLLTQDPNALAAGVPVLGQSAAGNGGGAYVASVTVVDPANPAFTANPGNLTPPLGVRFTGPATLELLDMTNPGAPLVLENGIAYTPGTGVFPTPGALDFGYQVTLTGTPQAGDLFTVDYNAAGVGDNRNALVMASLQGQPLFDGGNTSLQASYGQLLGRVGSAARAVATTSEATAAFAGQVRAQQQSVSGVNTDEEAANLLQFQQAYQAAARTLQVADEVFQTLLQATG